MDMTISILLIPLYLCLCIYLMLSCYFDYFAKKHNKINILTVVLRKYNALMDTILDWPYNLTANRITSKPRRASHPYWSGRFGD